MNKPAKQLSTAEAAELQGMTTTDATQIDAMTLVSQAVSNGAPMESVDKLIELVKFNDQREALRAFNQAFTAAQSELPQIKRTKKAHNSMYAPFQEIVNQLRPVLLNHGLSFRHEVTENDNKSVTVRCILAHEAGHSESAALTGPADTSGSKNDIQAIGSTVTYLKRYTLEAVTGVVTSDNDDDGKGAQTLTENQIADLNAKLDEAKDKDKLLDKIKEKYEIDNIGQIPQGKFKEVVARCNDYIKRESENADH